MMANKFTCKDCKFFSNFREDYSIAFCTCHGYSCSKKDEICDDFIKRGVE